MAPGGGGEPIPYDFWFVNEFNDGPTNVVTCECLMPTGHVIFLDVPHDYTFQEIKEVSHLGLWSWILFLTSKFLIFSICFSFLLKDLWYLTQRRLNLNDQSEYTFCVISKYCNSVMSQEVTDESKRLCDIQPYFCILQVIKKQITTDNKLEKHITELIGKSVQDFAALNNPEVSSKMLRPMTDFTQWY